MRLVILLFTLLSFNAYAFPLHMKVSPFRADLSMTRSDVTVKSATLHLRASYCFLIQSCQSSSEDQQQTAMKFESTLSSVSIELEKTAKLLSIKTIPFHLQGCTLFIILKAQKDSGREVIGRLDVGVIGFTANECSDQVLLDKKVQDFFNTNPEIRWLD